MLPQLLEACQKILSENPMFVMMTLYSIEASSVMAQNMLKSYFPKLGVSCGELALEGPGMPLPLSIWAIASAM